MINAIKEILSYPFLIRAITVGALVSLCAALLGVSLVLKRYSMIGDGLSHVGFGALAIATAFNAAPLKIAIPVVIAAAFLLLRISENSKIKGDAAIALISTGSLAVGVLIVYLTGNSNNDLCTFMFGNLLAVNSGDVTLSVIMAGAVLVLYLLFYNKIFAVTFDESFAKATGTPSGLYNMLLALLTAVTVVLGMRLMGALLISALIIFPSLTSMRVCKSFRGVVTVSALSAIVCFLAGTLVSYVFEVPYGASVVCVNIAVFIVFALAGQITARIRTPHGHERNGNI